MTRHSFPALPMPLLAALAVSLAALTACGGGDAADDREAAPANDSLAVGTDNEATSGADSEGRRQIASLATVRGKRVVPAPAITPPTAVAPPTTPTVTPPLPTGGSGSTGGTVVEQIAAAKPIANGDIRLQVEASQAFSSYKWLWGMECDGQKQGALNIPETGLVGTDLGGALGALRFGKAPDPADPSRKVLVFRPNMNDAYAAGAPRCEMTFSPSFNGKLPVAQDIWFAFGVRLQDWVFSQDEQILMQWHWGNGSIPLGPFLALSLKGNALKVDTKFNNRYPPAQSSTTSVVLWQNGLATANAWTYFVIKARISPKLADSPYVMVWRDGKQVVSYHGPVGYNYPEVTPYVKVGHYQWVASYNVWNPAAATKTVMMRTPTLIQDVNGSYAEPDVRQHVMDR